MKNGHGLVHCSNASVTGRGDDEKIVEEPGMSNTRLQKGERDDRQKLSADCWRGLETKYHAFEAKKTRTKLEGQERTRGWVHEPGQEAILDVEFAHPIAGLHLADGRVYRLIDQGLIFQKIVEVAGEVENVARLFRRFADDDMKRLDVVWIGVGAVFDSVDAFVFVKTSGDK